MPFSEFKLKRTATVTTMACASKLKIRNEIKAVDPLILFKRISILKKSDVELQNYLKYELVPYPLGLFNEEGMRNRKTDKAQLYKLFP